MPTWYRCLPTTVLSMSLSVLLSFIASVLISCQCTFHIQWSRRTNSGCSRTFVTRSSIRSFRVYGLRSVCGTTRLTGMISSMCTRISPISCYVSLSVISCTISSTCS
uniref:Uncharacterized protein n=1 Tax=Cacopsylla melanoneura TaxID=428564 RepID=A0A8D8LW43_9HEMI